jgi:GNAT superfamily N-acetyltransferase
MTIEAAVHVREARAADLPRIFELLAQLRDDPSLEDYAAARERYERAFAEVAADPKQTLLVAETGGAIAGTLVVIVVPNLTRRGQPYAIVENVVVDASARGQRVGERLMQAAIDIARAVGCYKVALTSARRRTDAHRFYERLGFVDAHKGYRLDL